MVAIIDIGSASTRLFKNEKKTIVMTKLGEGLSETGKLSDKAMDRTLSIISAFVEDCRKDKSDIYIFATEAVRSASNGMDFANKIKIATCLDIDILPPEVEAKIAFLGACFSGTGTVIDIGGASSEIIVGENGNILYAKSIPMGAVRLTDLGKRNADKSGLIASDIIKEYGIIPIQGDYYGVGGTLTSLAAMSLNLKEYNSDIVDGYKLTLSQIKKLGEKLINLTPKDICFYYPFMQPLRAEIITAGCILSIKIMEYLQIKEIIVSESDNLNGYKKYKGL